MRTLIQLFRWNKNYTTNIYATIRAIGKQVTQNVVDSNNPQSTWKMHRFFSSASQKFIKNSKKQTWYEFVQRSYIPTTRWCWRIMNPRYRASLPTMATLWRCSSAIFPFIVLCLKNDQNVHFLQFTIFPFQFQLKDSARASPSISRVFFFSEQWVFVFSFLSFCS